MIDFKGITHIIKNPAGSYSFVGAVPICLHDLRTPTQADIMGGRIHNGMVLKARTYVDLGAMIGDAQAHGANLCKIDGCACRKLF